MTFLARSTGVTATGGTADVRSGGGRVFGLDFMRALAILGVVGIHSIGFLPEPWLSSLRRIGPAFFGALGVELFFVLSGYLVGSLLLRVEWSTGRWQPLRTFWYRRWMRTLPNYFLFLAANVLFLWVVAGQLSLDWRYLFFLQNLAWPHPAFFPETWSLSVEEWFYLLIPLVLFVLTRRGVGTTRALLCCFAALLVLPLLGRMLCAGLDWKWDIVRGTVVLRLDAIMYGVAGALLHRRYPSPWTRLANAGLLIGVAGVAIAWAIILIVPRDTSLMKVLYFPFLSLALALCLPAASCWQLRVESMATGVIRRIALWSYSLYLCNLLVLRVIEATIPAPRSPALSLAVFALFWTASLAVSAVAYRCWEKPIMDLRDRRRDPGLSIQPGLPRPDV